MVNDPDTRELDFADDSLTENTRGAYPLDIIANARRHRSAARRERRHPDLRRLRGAAADRQADAAQAMYHFLSGYTSKVAGTERA